MAQRFLKVFPTGHCLCMEQNNEKIEKLKKALHLKLDEISVARNFALAFSGGLDSRFLAYFAKKYNFEPRLLHICGPHIQSSISDDAVSWAKSHGMYIRIFPLNPFDEPNFRTNPINRCYFCKKRLLSFIKTQTLLPITDGSNLSDLSLYRPGLKALQEIGIRSPLIEAGFTKEDVRLVARSIGLDHPNQPAASCLLTRFPYDFQLSEELIVGLGETEEEINDILLAQWDEAITFRVRFVQKDRIAVHFSQSDISKIYPEIQEKIRKVIREHFPSYPEAEIVGLKKLSGFFDDQTEKG